MERLKNRIGDTGGLVMPEIGEKARGRAIGFNSGNTFVWSACIDCGKERWVELRENRPFPTICLPCSARKNGFLNRKHEKTKAKGGYVFTRLQPTDFFYPMVTKQGYVLEHRLVVAKALGRCLHSWEIVHHKLGFAKDDNRYPETLELLMDDKHNQISTLTAQLKRLEAKVEEQAKLIKLLQWQLQEISKAQLGLPK